MSLPSDAAVRHVVLMTARDASGRVKVEKASIFDSGAYFNLEPTGSRTTSSVKGGPSWSFPGPVRACGAAAQLSHSPFEPPPI